jgi:hypothetical protein
MAVLASMASATIGVADEDMKAVALGWSARKQILDIEDGRCHAQPMAKAARAGQVRERRMNRNEFQVRLLTESATGRAFEGGRT